MLSVPAHLGILLAAALAFGFLPRPKLTPWTLPGLALLSLLPVAAFGLKLPDVICGTEGLGEAITEGALLTLGVRGLREKSYIFGVFSLILLGEELDWGQVLLSFSTPPWVDALSPRSTQMNFHNIPWLDWLWRPLPLVGLLLLSRRPWPPRWEPLAARLRLPAFHPGMAPAVVVTVIGTILSQLWVGQRAPNEAMELTFVLLVWAGQQPLSNAPPASNTPRPR